MSGEAIAGDAVHDRSVGLATLRFTVFSTRNMVFLIAVLAMNFTLMRPSPVDLLFIMSFLMTLFLLAVSTTAAVSRRAVALALVVATWALSFIVASLPHISEPNVPFELLAKTFAISIGVTGAFVSMTWGQRHFERFMKFYIVSCVIASILGTIGFVLQNDALTWDGRARGLIDDPNMYGSFLVPAVVFCLYFLFRPGRGKLMTMGALALVLLGIVLSFSRIAQVATMVCMVAYVVFQNRRRPKRLLLMVVGVVGIATLLLVIATLAPSEFSKKFLDRLTFAESYDLGEQGRYARYALVLPMIMQKPLGLGVLQLEKIFPEPIHNIWLSSFVNYGWVAGFTWITLVISSVVVSIVNYRRTRNDIVVVLLISLVGLVMCTSLHEGEHWRHLWLFFGLVWGLSTIHFDRRTRDAPTRQPVRRQAPSVR